MAGTTPATSLRRRRRIPAHHRPPQPLQQNRRRNGAAHQSGRKLHELLEADGQVLAVTAIPDEKKGERLVVVHTLKEDTLKIALEKLSKSDLPALWKPA